MNILSSGLLLTGDSFESFRKARSEFEKGSYLMSVNFGKEDFILWIFRQVKENNQIDVLQVNDIAFSSINNQTGSEECIVNKKCIDGAALPEEIFKDIKKGNIPVAIECRSRLMFVDANCISRLVSKSGVSSKLIYERGYIGYLVLYDAMKRMQESVAICIRKDGKYGKAMNILSDNTILHSAIPIVEEMEKETGFELMHWKIGQYNTNCFLEDHAIGPYIPVIRMDFSDTGHGNENYYLCVKTLDASKVDTGVIIAEFKPENFAEIYAKLKSAISNNAYSTESMDGKKVLRDKRVKHAIGKKRIEAVKPLFKEEKRCVVMEQVVRLPEIIGPINRSSDFELMTAAGRFFME